MFNKRFRSFLVTFSSTCLFAGLITGCNSSDDQGISSNNSGNNQTNISDVINENTHDILARQGVVINYPETWQTQAYYNAPPLEDEKDVSVKPRENSTFFNTVEVIDFLPTRNKNVTR